jgi:hypothetical protein
MLLAPGAVLLWERAGQRRILLVAAIIVCAALQLPGVLVDYSKVSVDWARASDRSRIEDRNWQVAASPFVLDARAALRAVPANVSYLAGREPLPVVETTSTAENRDFAQQLSFSLDFWWVYLVYLRAIGRGTALLVAVVLATLAVACAWSVKREAYACL